MKILHLIDSLGVGGAERLLVFTVEGLPDIEHHVLCLSAKGALRAALPETVEPVDLGFKSKKDILRCAMRLRRYIRQHQIQLVHSHLILSNLVARLGTPASVPLINSLHNLNGARFFRKKFSFASLAERLTYKKRHLIIAVSNEVLQDYQQYIGIRGKAVVLHNFVDDVYFRNAPRKFEPNGPLRLIAVGSLKPQKNYSFLLSALKSVSDFCTLDIYGDGPLREPLERQIASDNLPVRLMGNVQAVHQFFDNYDLFVMASKHEGHPIALLEAMASGMPAITSDIPVLREALEGEGLFFSLESPDSLARLILSIREGKIDIYAAASHNWRTAQKIGRKEEYLKKLLNIYSSMLAH